MSEKKKFAIIFGRNLLMALTAEWRVNVQVSDFQKIHAFPFFDDKGKTPCAAT